MQGRPGAGAPRNRPCMAAGGASAWGRASAWGAGGRGGGNCYKVTKKMANPKQKAPENAKIHKN